MTKIIYFCDGQRAASTRDHNIPQSFGYQVYNEPKETTQINHDKVIKWKHFPRYWTFVRGIHRSPVNSPHKGQWRGALMFSLICVWINGWVNNREAGDLRRYRAHYDVTVMLGKLYYGITRQVAKKPTFYCYELQFYLKSWTVCLVAKSKRMTGMFYNSHNTHWYHRSACILMNQDADVTLNIHRNACNPLKGNLRHEF